MQIPLEYLTAFEGRSVTTAEGAQAEIRVDGYVTEDDGSEVLALYDANSRGGAPLARGRSATEAHAPIDPILTTFVQGRQYTDTTWTDRLFVPTVPTATDGSGMATDETFQWPRWGLDYLAYHDTELPDRVPYKMSGLSVSWEKDELETHGWATDLTKREMALAASFLSWAVRKAALPMRVIHRWRQHKVIQMITDPTANATYATGHVTAITAGQEWDHPTGGDMLGDIQTGIAAISSATGADESQMDLEVSRSTYHAMLDSPGYKAHHAGVVVLDRSAQAANLQLLAQYLGIRSVMIINPTNQAGQPALGDIAILHIGAGPGPGYQADYGEERWGIRFAANDGVIQAPWDERLIRTRVMAADAQYKLRIMSPGAAYLWTNTSTKV